MFRIMIMPPSISIDGRVSDDVGTGLTVLGHARLVRHRSARSLTLFLAGCTHLLLGRFLGEEQPVGRLVPVAAATFLVSAHRRNRRCCLHAALHGPSARDVCSADLAATRLHLYACRHAVAEAGVSRAARVSRGRATAGPLS